MRFPNLFRRSSDPDLPARVFARRAALASVEERYRDAAALYVEALSIRPGHGAWHVQAGHMFKEAGELAKAEFHYDAAAALMPGDADLALQLGHFYKTAGRMGEAVAAYRRAAALKPGWAVPAHELQTVHDAGWRMPGEGMAFAVRTEDPFRGDPKRHPFDPELARDYTRLAAAQLPRPVTTALHRSEPSIIIRQFGVPLNSYWGILPIARGVEAIRGFCISAEPLIQVTALVNGLPIHHGPLKGPYELEHEPDRTRIHKYVFNIWTDFTAFAPGRYALELRFRDADLISRSLFQDFVVEPPLAERDFPDSDGIVTLQPGVDGTIEDRVAARPSAVHEAARPDRLADIHSILVLRPDQLGDLVASIPAILRLRALFPTAKLVGLFGHANIDLARTLGVFDETIAVDLPESMSLRTRILGLEAQIALRERLAAYRFDIAVDLAQSGMARSLLALSGAKVLYGFDDPAWLRLTGSVDDSYRDPKNGREQATHATRVLAMVDRLPKLFSSPARVLRRDDLPRDRLAALGIGPHDRFAVLHTGARIVFSRWGHYAELTERLHRDTDLKIVLFTDGPELRDRLSPNVAASDRVIAIDRQLPFDDFDALLSFCAVYVGNDSGPKHLASLRGVPVVSIHSARVNWTEWGQELCGVIVSRKVPCAGCQIYHDVEECGKDFVCVTGITVDDVYAAVRRYV